MLKQLDELEQSAGAALASVTDSAALEAWRIAHLGAKGDLKRLAAGLKDVPREEKPAVGTEDLELVLFRPNRKITVLVDLAGLGIAGKGG